MRAAAGADELRPPHCVRRTIAPGRPPHRSRRPIPVPPPRSRCRTGVAPL